MLRKLFFPPFAPHGGFFGAGNHRTLPHGQGQYSNEIPPTSAMTTLMPSAEPDGTSVKALRHQTSHAKRYDLREYNARQEVSRKLLPGGLTIDFVC